MVRSSDDNTDSLAIGTEAFLTRGYIGTISTYNQPRWHTANVNWSDKRYITLHQNRHCQEDITAADYADEQELLTNKHAQALIPVASPRARGIGLYVSTDKTEFIYF